MIQIVNAEQLKKKLQSDKVSPNLRHAVLEIMGQVKHKGDDALIELTAQFDHVQLTSIKVQNEEFEEAQRTIDPELKDVLQEATRNICDYHRRQTRQSWMSTSETGSLLGQLIMPLERVGVYVPGGNAAYPSSVLMNVIPAVIAGVPEIMMASPPGKDGRLNPAVLVAAQELGIREIYKMGGAQAIAAMAFGTESISKVDKITGPGNTFVAIAKREVFGEVGIDMVAGPSEVVILADEQANPIYVAADMLAQSEHDSEASSITVTPSKKLAFEIQRQIQQQMSELVRKDITRQSIERRSAICLTNHMDEAFQIVNDLAPEHLEVMLENPFDHLGKIKNAGAIFIGEDSPVPIGDYFVGPNHVLPTGRTARFSSPLSVDDFIKKSSLIRYSHQDIEKNGKKIMRLAENEGLQGHAKSIEYRLKNDLR